MNLLRYITRRGRRHVEIVQAGIRGMRYRRTIGAPWIKDAILLPIRSLMIWRTTTPFGLWRNRIRACRSCPMYDPVHRVCGNFDSGLATLSIPAIFDGEFGIPCGCRCKVGVRASHPNALCFLATIEFPKNYRHPGNWRLFNLSLDGRCNTTQPPNRQQK